ncbi:MAG: hypothetical protein A3A86_04020 [Elusimicrobia bacterium RIFCSPLOWO2_01_FULL_60_11]|nr:MAG: hypothetical protein A3A86_04020 [Elusimicrobia bacterium RIFCSPLOWO2_01_FULL_60_11]
MRAANKPKPAAFEPVPQAWVWLALAWACFVAYKYLHANPLYMKVFESVWPIPAFVPTFSALGTYALGSGLFLGMAAGAFVLGRFALGFLRVSWACALEEAVLSVSAGYGLLGLLMLLLTSLHLIFPSFLFGVWVAGVAAFVFGILRRSGFKECLSEAGKQARSFLFIENPLILRVFLWIFLAMSLMMTFVPDLFYDALVYHLAVPNLFLQENGLARVQGVLSKSPMIWHMLYLYGLGLSDEILPKLIHWSTGLLIILGMGTLSKRSGLPRAGMPAGLFFISIPMVQMNIWTCGVDIGGCLYAFLALYAVLAYLQAQDAPAVAEGRESPERGWVAVSALFSGFAYGSKYQGGMIGISASLIFVLYFALYARDARRFLRTALPFTAVLILAVLPWLAKNVWDTGNPVFPFLTDLFERWGTQTYHADPEQLKNFIAENRRFLTDSWPQHLRLPWLLTFSDSNQSSLSFPGPLLLAFLPFCLLVYPKFRQKWMQAAGVFILAFFTFSFVSTHLTRYHLMGYPILCFVYAAGFTVLLENKNALMKILSVALLSVMLLGNLQVGLLVIENSYRPWDVWVGNETREAYRMYTHPGLNPNPSNSIFRWMEKNLPKKSRILIIGESKAFDLKLPYVYSDVFGRNAIVTWTEESRSPEELHAKIQAAGVTHIFINFEEARRTYGYKMLKWQGDNLKKFEEFWNVHVRPVHQERAPERLYQGGSILLLYEILDKDAARAIGAPTQNPLTALDEYNGRK